MALTVSPEAVRENTKGFLKTPKPSVAEKVANTTAQWTSTPNHQPKTAANLPREESLVTFFTIIMGSDFYTVVYTRVLRVQQLLLYCCPISGFEDCCTQAHESIQTGATRVSCMTKKRAALSGATVVHRSPEAPAFGEIRPLISLDSVLDPVFYHWSYKSC